MWSEEEPQALHKGLSCHPSVLQLTTAPCTLLQITPGQGKLRQAGKEGLGMAEGWNRCRLEAQIKQQGLTRLSPPYKAVREQVTTSTASLRAGWNPPRAEAGLFAELRRGAGAEQGSGFEPRVGRGGGRARSGFAFGDVLGAAPGARLGRAEDAAGSVRGAELCSGALGQRRVSSSPWAEAGNGTSWLADLSGRVSRSPLARAAGMLEHRLAGSRAA